MVQYLNTVKSWHVGLEGSGVNLNLTSTSYLCWAQSTPSVDSVVSLVYV